jgi:hypothetical protein
MSKIFKSGDFVAVHENPVWKNKSNYIIRYFLEEKNGRNEWEQLWVQKINERVFLVCCIPFFAYDIDLGDEVETDESYSVIRISKKSGQHTFRIWFGDTAADGKKEQVHHHLKEMLVLQEWSSPNLLAISAPSDSAQKVADYLQGQQDAGDLIFETGRA